jgi:CheY-like chemotaxis protein
MSSNSTRAPAAKSRSSVDDALILGYLFPVRDVPILLVASDEPTRSSIAGALTGRGYQITSFTQGDEALKNALAASPGVIVLDVAAPHLDVAVFVRTLRTHPESALVPVLFLGEQAPVEEKIQGFQLGSDDFLTKPVDPREVELRVAVANKLREKAESVLRPKNMDSPDFSSPGMLTAFRGTLDQIGLPSILSLVDMERKTGMLVLVLEPGKEKARVYFRDGRVMRALYDKKDRPKNAALVYELLGRTEGKFEFRNMVVDSKDEVLSPTAHLLLEGARLIDEARRSS